MFSATNYAIGPYLKSKRNNEGKCCFWLNFDKKKKEEAMQSLYGETEEKGALLFLNLMLN